MTTRAAGRSSPGARLLALWARCEGLPFGRELFALALRFQVPYSASIGPRVLTLAPGHAKVALPDRAGVRNHLGSIHAVALTNLGELTSGLAMTAALPASVRGIVRSITTEYTKKARGTLVAESRVALPAVTGDTDFEVVAEIRDAGGETVARVHVLWRLGLVPDRAAQAS
jgi:acyl-coenzyme A thioesterase PaaI-like protein